MQFGGSDHWVNIVNGTELIKRYSNKIAYGLTTPLITLATGAKMGKTETGAVWLDKKLLSSYDYWQFWRNTDDRDVIKFLKMFTDLNVNEIDEIKNEDINQLKIKLANEATAMLHGKKDAEEAASTAKQTFEQNLSGDGLPTYKISKNKINNKLTILELISSTKIDISKSEIRRLIKGKAIKINNKTVEDEKYLIKNETFSENNFLKLSIGKKKHIKIQLN